MAHISGPLIVEQFGEWWVLHNPINYTNSQYIDHTIQVPSGFVTDFASVPLGLWNLFPPWDHRYSSAAVVHDKLYESHEVPRKIADAVFYEAMRSAGTRRVRAAAMWAAVRCFGCYAYRSGPGRQAERLQTYRQFSGLTTVSG